MGSGTPHTVPRGRSRGRCPEEGQPGAGTSPAYLSTDSTNTRSALMWIQAMKASLKFTFSQRSRGPCKDRRAVAPPGPSARGQAKKGHRVGRASPELRRNTQRPAEAAGRSDHVLQGAWCQGSSARQPPGTCVGPPQTGLRGSWAAPDLRAFSRQLTGFRLTLRCQGAQLLGRLWASAPRHQPAAISRGLLAAPPHMTTIPLGAVAAGTHAGAAGHLRALRVLEQRL